MATRVFCRTSSRARVGSSDAGLERTIADYIAGMTDRYADPGVPLRLFDPTVRA